MSARPRPVATEPLRVSIWCEQLFQTAPGGIGTYVQALLARLPDLGVELEPMVAWHTRGDLRRAGLPRAHRVRAPRSILHWGWALWGRPNVRMSGDLVHAPSLAFPPAPGAALVVTVHDLFFRSHPELYPPRGVRFHERSLERLSQADLVICPSNATAEQLSLAQRAVPRERLRVVPMGTDLAAPGGETIDRVLAQLRLERPYVLWVGTVEPRKNLGGALRGFAHMLRSIPAGHRPRLCLAGPRGWEMKGPGELIREAGLDDDAVLWLGNQPRSHLAALYAGAEAFLFPSLAEGFGLPVLEAMACGTPVVTSRGTALSEIAGDAAILCDPTDPDSIGDALARVLEDVDLADALRRRGREQASRFTWERTARDTAACYAAALESTKP